MKDKIKEEVLRKINKGEVKIRSKAFFEFLKIGLIVLMVLSIALAIFLMNFAFYLSRKAGIFRGFHPGRLFFVLSSMPWLLIFVGAIFIGLFIYIYRNYEGGYKKHLSVIIVIVSLLVLALGCVMTISKVNERFENLPRIKGFYQWGEKRFGPKEGKPKIKGKRFPNSQKPLKGF